MAHPILEQHWPEPVVAAHEHEAMFTEVRRRLGLVPRFVRHTCWVPWVTRFELVSIIRPFAHLDQKLFEMAVMVAVQVHSCRFCYGAQIAVMRIFGFDEATLMKLEGDFQSLRLDPAWRDALEFVRLTSRSGNYPRRLAAKLLDDGFEREAVAELAFVAAEAAYSARVATALSLPPTEVEIFNRSWMRFLRPVARWVTGDRFFGAPAERLSAEDRDGPFSYAVEVLDGSPSARLLREAIDGALASDVLPLRTKALSLAVVGRSVGCPAVEAQARDLLRDELPAEVVDQALDHLRSDGLSALDNRLLQFSRLSVRYELSELQRQTQLFAEELGPAELVELVGIVALANALCRLSVLMGVCEP